MGDSGSHLTDGRHARHIQQPPVQAAVGSGAAGAPSPVAFGAGGVSADTVTVHAILFYRDLRSENPRSDGLRLYVSFLHRSKGVARGRAGHVGVSAGGARIRAGRCPGRFGPPAAAERHIKRYGVLITNRHRLQVVDQGLVILSVGDSAHRGRCRDPPHSSPARDAGPPCAVASASSCARRAAASCSRARSVSATWAKAPRTTWR